MEKLKNTKFQLNNRIKSLLIGLSLLLSPIFYGQNLIVNGDFENSSGCPDQTGLINLLDGWSDFSLTGSFDYLSTCCDSNITSMCYFLDPTWYNSAIRLGYQIPRSGNNIIGGILLCPAYPFRHLHNDQNGIGYFEIRESVMGTFTQPLSAGLYYFEFYVTLPRIFNCAITSEYEYVYNTIDEFDLVILSNNNKINKSYPPFMSGYNITKLKNKSNEDTLNWHKVSTCFQANGGETNFALGVFRDTIEIELVQHICANSQFSELTLTYYYFDDFSLTRCDTCCPDQFPIPTKPTIAESVSVSSNPSTFGNPTIFSAKLNKDSEAEIWVYDSAGRIVGYEKLTQTNASYELPKLANAIYHYRWKTTNAKGYGKVLGGGF